MFAPSRINQGNKMRFLYLLAIVFCLKLCAADIFYDLVREEWNSFKVQYPKTYGGSIEESYRFKIFMANLKAIHLHNQRFELGQETYKKGVNQFTDMFDFEVKKIMCGINGTALSEKLKSNETAGFTFLPLANVNVPDEINWNTKGAVTPVKNQGHCGSCWAFSSTGSLEGQTFRLNGKLVSLSEQNLMDCSRSYGNKGCDGGMMDRSFQYIRDNRGIDTEESYPYEGIDRFRCKYVQSAKGASCRGYTLLPPFDENTLKIAVATIGPISVAIEASSAFMSYFSGVFYDPNCQHSPDTVNHGVLVVGYGKDPKTGLDYWLVKNSWGETWGENGYVKMARNKGNNCNIATYGIYPLV